MLDTIGAGCVARVVEGGVVVEVVAGAAAATSARCRFVNSATPSTAALAAVSASAPVLPIVQAT